MTRKLLYFLLLLILSIPVYAIEKIRIGRVFAPSNEPLLIAKEKGLFKAEGIDVEIRAFKSAPVVHQSLAAGKPDMAYIGAPPVYLTGRQIDDAKIWTTTMFICLQ